MHYTIYQITNLINGKVYIGAHKTNDLEDDYMGSGKILGLAKAKYGIEYFTKDIIANFDTSEEMFNMEATLVNEDFVKRKDTYNIKEGGFGGWNFVAVTKTSKERSAHAKIGGLTRHISVSELSDKIKEGQQHSKDQGWVPGAHTLGKCNFKGQHHTESAKKKIGKKNSVLQAGANNSQYGTMWVTNGSVNKKIKINDTIPKGFKKGRVLK